MAVMTSTRGRGRPTDFDGREAVLEAAKKLAELIGLARLRITHVARAAGVDESTVKYHYPTQAELIEAVRAEIEGSS